MLANIEKIFSKISSFDFFFILIWGFLTLDRNLNLDKWFILLLSLYWYGKIQRFKIKFWGLYNLSFT